MNIWPDRPLSLETFERPGSGRRDRVYKTHFDGSEILCIGQEPTANLDDVMRRPSRRQP